MGSGRRAGFGPGDGEERDPEVAQLVQQSVKGRLVGDGASQGGRAVVGARQVEAVEPGSPAVVESALDTDLVPVTGPGAGRFARRSGGGVAAAHGAKLGTDLMRARHHR